MSRTERAGYRDRRNARKLVGQHGPGAMMGPYRDAQARWQARLIPDHGWRNLAWQVSQLAANRFMPAATAGGSCLWTAEFTWPAASRISAQNATHCCRSAGVFAYSSSSMAVCAIAASDADCPADCAACRASRFGSTPRLSPV